MAGGSVDRAHDTLDHREQVDLPHLDDAGQGEHCERCGDQHREELRPHDGVAQVVAVEHRADEEAEDGDREQLAERECADGDR